MTILFARPADDSAAIIAASCGQLFRKMATAYPSTDLNSGQVTRQNIDREIGKHRHLFWFGHGTADALIAFGAVVIDQVNLGNLQGGMVVAIACDAGESLGTVAQAGGNVAAFLGFDDEFVFPPNAEVQMAQALCNGLSCLFSSGHDIACAADQLRHQFVLLKAKYKAQGQAGQLSHGDARLAKLCAANHHQSLQLHGDGSTVL